MRMKLAIPVLLCVLSSVAAAQTVGGDSLGPSLDTGEYDEDAPSPEYTQDRTFGGTRFWKIDAGRYEVQQWWRLRKSRDEDAYHIFQTEIEIGLTKRVQLDIYENLSTESGELEHEGNQIEARIAIDPVYGRTPLNPVIYLEWHPRHLTGDRAEVRLLGGEALLADKLLAAGNLFYEQNVTDSIGEMGAPEYIANPEYGATAGASYAFAGQTFRGGAEAKVAFEKERFSDEEWEFQVLAGPNLSGRIGGERFKWQATMLFGITDDAKQIDAFFIVGSGF